jgi:hypothetical protein
LLLFLVSCFDDLVLCVDGFMSLCNFESSCNCVAADFVAGVAACNKELS